MASTRDRFAARMDLDGQEPENSQAGRDSTLPP